ncbi:hypothetical protein An03g01720 [Aspergillus niger]|uniref:Uncharacterized protein n=2 Tax=Aspergillus niger TaxID=5061 RepID=A2QG35_ASPNC|nr:hypothetical protein An03g01720 [Aspergillus niger]CAK38145.1 hypothetical protein An03g01720 [Aspergillus niger]
MAGRTYRREAQASGASHVSTVLTHGLIGAVERIAALGHQVVNAPCTVSRVIEPSLGLTAGVDTLEQASHLSRKRDDCCPVSAAYRLHPCPTKVSHAPCSMRSQSIAAGRDHRNSPSKITLNHKIRP